MNPFYAGLLLGALTVRLPNIVLAAIALGIIGWVGYARIQEWFQTLWDMDETMVE